MTRTAYRTGSLGPGCQDAASTLTQSGVDAYYDVIARFDAAVDEAVGNASLRAALDTVRTHLIRARRIAADDARRLERAAHEHRLICEAIRDGDSELAVAATTVHLRGSMTTILAKLGASDDLLQGALR